MRVMMMAVMAMGQHITRRLRQVIRRVNKFKQLALAIFWMHPIQLLHSGLECGNVSLAGK